MTAGGMDVVCVGLATWDSICLVRGYPPADGRAEAVALERAGGGPAATAAVALARLGHRVAFVGAVGDDAVGEEITRSLSHEGVDVDGLRVVRGARSPESLILVDEGTGTRSISAYPGTAGPPQLTGRAAERCAAARWIHVDHLGYAPVRALMTAGPPDGWPPDGWPPDERRPRLCVDGGNPIPGLDLRGVDLYSPTASMLCARYLSLSLDDALRAALDEGCEAVVATLGREGARALERGGAPFSVPAAMAPIRSTLGAGDVFHGAILAGSLEGRSLAEATARANLAAALACRALDGRSAIPTREGLEAAWVSGGVVAT